MSSDDSSGPKLYRKLHTVVLEGGSATEGLAEVGTRYRKIGPGCAKMVPA